MTCGRAEVSAALQLRARILSSGCCRLILRQITCGACSSEYSYTRLIARNATVLHLEQVKVLPTPTIWRAIDIVQPSHGPF